MKRHREGYSEDNDTRLRKTVAFISGLRFSLPLSRLRERGPATERRPCPRCGRRRLHYCYDCLAVTNPETHPPPLPLPLNVYVILHPGELRAKSTSLAAATISPDLHIVPYPSVPEGLQPEDTLVLYPSAQSVELGEVAAAGELHRYKNVVFVDSTWQQSKAIARDERVSRFRHVRIRSQTSLFWRFQNNDPSHLATVEAIYYFLREYVAHRNRHQQQQEEGDTADNTAAITTTTTSVAASDDAINNNRRSNDNDSNSNHASAADASASAAPPESKKRRTEGSPGETASAATAAATSAGSEVCGTNDSASNINDNSNNNNTSSTDETADAVVRQYYHGEVDDLLYYYINQYIEIQQRYCGNGNNNSKSTGSKTTTGDSAAQGKGDANESMNDTTTTTSTTTTNTTGSANGNNEGGGAGGAMHYTDRHFEGYVLQGADWEALLANSGKRKLGEADK